MSISLTGPALPALIFAAVALICLIIALTGGRK